MKTKLILAILLALFCLSNSQSSAQQYIIQVKPAAGDLWGYANLKGELIIPAQFSKCTEFSDNGIATVFNDITKQYYFINTKGEKLSTEITEFKLNSFFGFDVKGFSNGFIAISQNKKWGYLNSDGKLAIQIKYDDATEFNDGYAVVKSGLKYIVVNSKAEEFNVDAPEVVNVKAFSENLAPYKSINKLFGYIGIDGKIAIQAQFKSVGYFSDGLAWAETPAGILGYINPKGEWVIKPQFSSAKNFDHESGLARVKIGEKWAYTNKTGDILNITDAESFGNFCEGLAEGKKNIKIGFLNNKGQWAIEPQFDDIREFKNGYATVKQGEIWGVIDKSGKFAIQPSYSAIKDVELIK